MENNEIKLEDPAKIESKAQECASKVNAIMKNYNCYFATQIIFDNGQILNNVIIKEKTE
jgi:hypothetical protein